MESAPASLKIQETFVSLQGEGARVGVPSRFIRVAGCNLRCAWCDSPESSWAPRGEMQSIDELVELCALGPRDVVLTGGEPLLFAGIAALSQRLHAAGHHITVETAGTVWLDDLHCDLISISPKLAHSTPHAREPKWVQRHEAVRRAPEVVARLIDAYPTWQLKFVVRWRETAALRADLEEIDAWLDALGRKETAHAQQVQLMPECVDPAELSQAYAALMPVCIERGFRLGERLHIHIFGHQPGT